MRIAFAALFALLATPALAQFPPPGVYDCTLVDGSAYGTLNLFVAGDYELVRPDGSAGKGQVASAGTDVRALSGPLAEAHVSGAFETDERDETRFVFASDVGEIGCALPPE